MSATALPAESTVHITRENAPDTGLRDRLRAATTRAHARLDAQLTRLDLRSLAGYRRFLEVTAGALLPLEAALIEADVGEVFPDWPKRSRSRALLDDLHRIGGVVRPLAAPQPLDRHAVLGTMYVLEGSRLGAKMLAGLVSASQDSTVASATAYLRHGAGLRLWRSFLVTLERHGAAISDDGPVVAVACRAFGLFEQAVSDMSGVSIGAPVEA